MTDTNLSAKDSGLGVFERYLSVWIALAIILGIDRFMSEARALTNLVSNGVATVVIARMEGAVDVDRMRAELDQKETVDAE